MSRIDKTNKFVPRRYRHSERIQFGSKGTGVIGKAPRQGTWEGYSRYIISQ